MTEHDDFEGLKEALGPAEIAPPPALDALIRRAIAEWRPARPFRWAWAAAALAVGACALFVTGLTYWLAETEVADSALPVAATIVAAYLMLSSAISLPVLLTRRATEARA